MNDHISSPSQLFFFLTILLAPFFAPAQGLLDSLPPVDSLSDWRLNDIAQQLTAQARYFDNILSEKSLAARTKRAAMEENWLKVKADSTISKIVLDSIAGLLKAAKTDEKIAIRNQNQSAKTLELANKTAASDNIFQRNNLRKLWKEIRKTNSITSPIETPQALVEKNAPEVKEKKREKKQKQKPPNAPVEAAETPNPEPSNVGQTSTENPPPSAGSRQPSAISLPPLADVMLHPPARPCVMAVKTRDEFSGEVFKKTESVEIFRHAPAALKNFLQGKPNVRCEAALASAGSNAFLHLQFLINDPSPRKAFGRLEKNGLATLMFMDGSSFTLYSQQTDEGIQNPDDQVFVFQAQYPLTADFLKKIRRTELDKIRIAWSSGYEDYDVQYVHLLMELARCLVE